MASSPHFDKQRKDYLRSLGYRHTQPDTMANRFYLWDRRVRWVRHGATLPYADSTCLAGQNCRALLSYEVGPSGWQWAADAAFYLHSDLSARHRFVPARLLLDGAPLAEEVRFVDQKGTLSVVTTACDLVITHTFYTAMQSSGLIQRITISNEGPKTHTLSLSLPAPSPDPRRKSLSYLVETADESGKMLSRLGGEVAYTLAPDQTQTVYIVYYCLVAQSDLLVDCVLEYKKAIALVEECFDATLSLATPDSILDTTFAHAATYTCMCVASTAKGPLSIDMPCGLTLEDWVSTIPYHVLSGNHRGLQSVFNALCLFADGYKKGNLPASLDVSGVAVGCGDELLFALGCGLVAAYTTSLYPEIYDAIRSAMPALDKKDGFARHALAAGAFHYMGLWALKLGKIEDYGLWQGLHKDTLAMLDTRFGLDKKKPYHVKEDLDLAYPMALGLPIKEGCAPLLGDMYDGGARLQRGSVADDSDLLVAALGLAVSGYHAAAHRILIPYSVQCLLGQGGPYPTDSRHLGGPASLRATATYCSAVTLGLWGLYPLGDGLGICLHFPDHWRHATLRHVHYGGGIYTLHWCEDVLVVDDLYGQERYRDSVRVGQWTVIKLK